MVDSRVIQTLGITYPILQAGMPWVSNPELVAAVSNAGGLGIMHPSASMSADGDMIANLQENLRRVRRLTGGSFGVAFYLANPLVSDLINAAIEEGLKTVVTYGGSPALYTGLLKSNDVTVMHQVSTLRHARGAEAQGVDIIIAEGFEGGGLRGPDEIPNFVLLPQIADALSIPIVASGGIMDSRGYVAALALGAHGVQMGTRFVATHECAAHPRYKEALLGAIDTGTVIAGRYHRPTRVLRSDVALRIRDTAPPASSEQSGHWEAELGPAQVRAAMLDGDFSGVAYCGAGVGLVSEILGAGDIVRDLVAGAAATVAALR
jgi:enoyl-[acyl-carrier protein] reductase II